MQLTSQQTLPVSQAQAWEALNDVTLLQAAIPGCESVTATGADRFDVLLTAAVGPVKARFKGKLQLENLQPPASFALRFEGQGGAAGFGKGYADIRLQPAGARGTVLHYDAHATVGGKLAQVGSRLVAMTAQKMASEFFESFNLALQERYGAVVAPPLPPSGLLARLWAWLRRLFGR
jgi:hypothetical protein